MEKKEGTCEYLDHELLITDLPGTYSLTAHSADEARQELQLANSAAGRIGHWLEPVLKTHGFRLAHWYSADWRFRRQRSFCLPAGNRLFPGRSRSESHGPALFI